MRECGTCTKCCDGYLNGVVNGHKFHGGMPCFYSSKNGCVIYKDRPEDPCKSFNCEWLIDDNFPFWMKPNEVNAIVAKRKVNGIEYYEISEAGEKLRVEVLNWMVLYCVTNQLNVKYQISGEWSYYGSLEFIKKVENK